MSGRKLHKIDKEQNKIRERARQIDRERKPPKEVVDEQMKRIKERNV